MSAEELERETQDGKTRCAYCGEPITIIRGHRKRKYCSDACKNNAWKAKEAEKARLEAERLKLEQEERERQQLRERYGNDLLPETIESLRYLRVNANYSSMFVDALARMIRAEIDRVSTAGRGQDQQERDRLAQAMMELGEPDFRSLMVGDELVILGGHRKWQLFAEKASVEHLRAIYELYIAPMVQQQERQQAVVR